MSRLLWGLLLLSIAGTLVVYGRSLPRPTHERVPGLRPGTLEKQTVLPAFGSVPNFTLTDQNSRPLENRNLLGKVWIADFIFTSCAGACPRMSALMAHLQKELPAEILLVSVTVDPVRDTPPVLAQYAIRYGADSTRWYFLTGPEKEIDSLVRQGFRLSYAEGEDPSEPITHSQRFVLIDRQGKIRGTYDSTEETALNQLKTDARTL